MSESNGKVCCSCEHNIRIHKINGTKCFCNIDNHYIGYLECMTGFNACLEKIAGDA